MTSEYRLIFSDEIERLVTSVSKITGKRNKDSISEIMLILESIEMRMTHEVTERSIEY